jgi:nucleoside-diphosphate-sugar epimerase
MIHRVLVTGACGLVGKALVARLTKSGAASVFYFGRDGGNRQCHHPSCLRGPAAE